MSSDDARPAFAGSEDGRTRCCSLTVKPDNLAIMLNPPPTASTGGLTPAQVADLQVLATRAAERSYSPYSRFRVGAALLLDNGSYVTGCNVENASYRLTTCAEQTAICAAVAAHGPEIRIRAIAVANLNAAASMPCGACRQTILEFAGPETPVFHPALDGELTVSTIADLLPAAFSRSDLAPRT